MLFRVPIYLATERPAGGGPAVQTARPLFFPDPVERGQNLNRLMARLARHLGERLATLARQDRHDELADWSFCPEVAQQRLELTVHLRRRTARLRYLFVTFRSLGRRVAFTPSLPDLWFDVLRGEDLAARSAEVLTEHFRKEEREQGDDFDPEATSLTGTASVTTIELDVRPPIKAAKVEKLPFALLGDAGPMHGSAELRRVGRCLDWLYPDELDRVVLRDAEVAELSRLLAADDRRPVLLVGPRGVGKTALVHEVVFRRVAVRSQPFRDQGNVWLLAPARLISGMSYVGQWENRLLAVLKEARRRDHVLYFDDLLGLFQAGVSASSSLNVAAVLKPYVERRDLRVLAEITPEALRVLREQDRGLADLFHVVPVREPNEEETWRVLIAVQRLLEGRHRCRFDLEALPAVLDLQRRYARGEAFPGKAARFLRQLAVKHATAEGTPAAPAPDVTRAGVLAEFHAQSGLKLAFLDGRSKLERREVVADLGKMVVGQADAVQAAADVLAVAKARLNDPGRPLATLLFLGPTGVGKTECAKAVARYLFGDADRLLRFDLNEYSAPGSAARLIGTFAQPEGLLTAAVRRQPFAVILLDEVEKADPGVFDLLLQVLGEGRLTDALGRTVDFSNTIVVLTSNLGVREAENRLGFRTTDEGPALDAPEPDPNAQRPRDAEDAAVFVRAAEGFFRPEFFNRLDRIIPFRRLTRPQVAKIAERLLRELFEREGFRQRKCILQLEPGVLERVADAGYDSALGARALKRAVERELAQPIAAHLAALTPDAITVVRVLAAGASLPVQVQGLTQAEPLPPPPPIPDDPAAALAAVESAVARLLADAAALRPGGALAAGEVRPEHYRYFELRDFAGAVRGRARDLREQLAERHGPSGRVTSGGARPPSRKGEAPAYCGDERHFGDFLRKMAAAEDMNEYLHNFTGAGPAAAGVVPAALTELRQRTALLATMVRSASGPEVAEQVLLVLRPLVPEAVGPAFTLRERYAFALGEPLGLEVTRVPQGGPQQTFAVLLTGAHAAAIAALEVGTHLFSPRHANLAPVQVLAEPLAAGEDADAALRRLADRGAAWREGLAAGRAGPSDDPFPLGPVLRVYAEEGGVADLRTGQTAPWPPNGTTLARFVLATLPVPGELSSE